MSARMIVAANKRDTRRAAWDMSAEAVLDAILTQNAVIAEGRAAGRKEVMAFARRTALEDVARERGIIP